MSSLLELKEKLKILYSKYSAIAVPMVKFITAFLVFLTINSRIGYYAPLRSIGLIAVLSLACAFLPNAVIVWMSMLLSIGHVYSISYILAIALLLFYVILYCLYFRYVPKQSYVALALPVLYAYNVPYVLPLLLGLFVAPISMISILIGIVISNLFLLIQEAAQLITNAGADTSGTVNMFNYIVDKLMDRRYMLVSMVIFIGVYLITFIIRKRSVSYASVIAIASAGAFNLVAFFIANLLMDGEKVGSGNWSVFLGTALSVAIAMVVQFFHMTLDYTGVKNVQFEDDDYYYYVKAIPKIVVATSEKRVKRIHAQKVNRNTLNLQDELQKAYSRSMEYQESYQEDGEEGTDAGSNFGGGNGSD